MRSKCFSSVRKLPYIRIMDKSENILYICILLLLLVSQPALCKKNKYVFSRKTNDQEHNRNETCKGRIEGAQINHNVPDFLGTTWAHERDGKDGKMLGLIIGMGGSYVMMAGSTYHGLESLSLDHNRRAKFMIPSAESFWSGTNPNPSNFKDIFKFDAKNTNLNSGPFGLFKVEIDPKLGGALKLPTFAAPKLEHDVKELGKDCRAYGWSRKLWTGRGANEIMQFADFEVRPIGCSAAICSVSSGHNANFCGGHGDNGIPVLCGQEKKLTYLLYGSPKGDIRCRTDMMAYHVPHMVSDLREFINV